MKSDNYHSKSINSLAPQLLMFQAFSYLKLNPLKFQNDIENSLKLFIYFYSKTSLRRWPTRRLRPIQSSKSTRPDIPDRYKYKNKQLKSFRNSTYSKFKKKQSVT
ncbi:hypothetical protein BpHYR1_002443 [Brachionus plicatilis]|uniref:Uncharacterized protein n=1 Tax=Brachionus plicatilis TaxID=10195 RepID=A0A3M7QWK7_BRAPC|nr:hypothetical protein BpHYR1_002443 [Brachionus plicatilis]